MNLKCDRDLTLPDTDDRTFQQYKFDRAADEKLVEQAHNFRMHTMESMRSYGQNAIRGVFLLNGGAAIALLTLIGSLYGRSSNSTQLADYLMESAAESLWYFGLGLSFSVVASALAYINYGILSHYEWHHREAHAWIKIASDPPRSVKAITYSVNGTALASVLFAAGSLVCFVLGGLSFYEALRGIARV